MPYWVQSKTGIALALDTTFNTLKGSKNLHLLPERKQIPGATLLVSGYPEIPLYAKAQLLRKLVNIASTDQVSGRRNEAILKEDIAL